MGLYNDVFLPRAIDRMCGSAGFDKIRDRLLGPAHGEVLEIGFGSGTNLSHYPSSVTGVFAVEPAPKMRELAGKRIRQRALPVTFVELSGSEIVADAGSCDTAVSTFTLCTVEDPAATLSEIRRVLRPGGTLLIAEHGRAPETAMATSQRLLEPIQRRLAGGCHLTREPLELLQATGFDIVAARQDYLGARSPWGYLTVATARS
ncbi:MAG: hypothetical protein QG671_4105 [Actinomycetota bacterium]|nr:hypothetical protein [Actinomycetota bacterium]